MKIAAIWMPAWLSVALLLASGAPAQAGADPLDIQTLEVFRFVDRENGVVLEAGLLPYQFEACAVGLNIASATLALPSGGNPIPLIQDPGSTEWCTGAGFETHAELVQAFPDGNYQFIVNGPSEQDRKTVTMNAAEPGAFTAITSPLQGATVPSDQDLNLAWTLTEKPNGAGCLSAQGGATNCANALAFAVFDLNLEAEVDSDLLPINTTNVNVPASALADGQLLEIEVESFFGSLLFGSTTDLLGDSVDVFSLYEDINLITVQVPEPSAALLGAASLCALAAVRRYSTVTLFARLRG